LIEKNTRRQPLAKVDQKGDAVLANRCPFRHGGSRNQLCRRPLLLRHQLRINRSRLTLVLQVLDQSFPLRTRLLGLPLHQQVAIVRVDHRIRETIRLPTHETKGRRLPVLKQRLAKFHRRHQRIHLIKRPWHRGLKRYAFAGGRMREGQSVRMEHQPRRGDAAILRVSHNRKPVIRRMPTDLVGLACQRSCLHEKVVAMRFDQLKLRHAVRRLRPELLARGPYRAQQ